MQGEWIRHSPGKLRSAAFLARGVDWITTKTDRVLHNPLATEGLACEETEILELSHALNLPKDIMSQARDLFQRHANLAFNGSCLLKDRRLTEVGFAKIWFEMIGQEDEAEDSAPLEILAEAFRHAGKTRELEFSQFAIWFSSRSFCEDVLDKESKWLRRIARKHSVHHAEVENYNNMFNRFDKDGNGTIDSTEFQELLCACIKAPASVGLPAARVKNLWKIADEDGDHEINFEEFLRFYTKYLGTDSTGFEDFYRFGGASRVGESRHNRREL